MARRSRPVVAALLAGALAAGSTGVASADFDECVAQLRDVPLETLELPSGFAWNSLTWAKYGAARWEGSIIDREDSGVALDVVLTCSYDAAADMARSGEIASFLGWETRLDVTLIGDESLALRDDNPENTFFGGVMSIEWRNGAIIGVVSDRRGADDQDVGMLEQLAQDVDARLP